MAKKAAKKAAKKVSKTATKTRRGSVPAKASTRGRPKKTETRGRKASRSISAVSAAADLSENALPKGFKASTDITNGFVTIRRGDAEARIRMSSYTAVANALAMFAGTPRVRPSSPIEILDRTRGKKAAITAGSLPDIAHAVSTFFSLGETTDTGRREETAQPAGKQARPATVARTETKENKQSTSKKVRAEPQSEAPPPDWFANGFKDEYVSDAGFRLVRTPLVLADERTVAGRRHDWPLGPSAWGYEVLAGKTHVAWVIAQDPRTFILTGALDLPPSTHRVIEGAMARIAASVMPKLATS